MNSNCAGKLVALPEWGGNGKYLSDLYINADGD
jgi:hypothetical protein